MSYPKICYILQNFLGSYKLNSVSWQIYKLQANLKKKMNMYVFKKIFYALQVFHLHNRTSIYISCKLTFLYLNEKVVLELYTHW